MLERLARYKSKRNFGLTPEPAEGSSGNSSSVGSSESKALAFVIQKHWASRLHYDFRLELNGTLLSWAIPKGPSFDPKDKRMAVHVEDHPLAYADFEGTIPARQYGAGKVIVWDKGIWTPVGDPAEGYASGNLKFVLDGHKLHGKWALVRMKTSGQRQEAWLLIKEKDAFARPAAEFSVVDEQPDSVGTREPPVAPSPSQPAQRCVAQRGRKVSSLAAANAPLPESFSPQLATPGDRAPHNESDWLCEIKFDGYRLLARIDGPDIRLFTRNGNDWTARLDGLHRELKRLKLPSGWYDGEMVVMNDQGLPDFGALQAAIDSPAEKNIQYFLFDAPYLNGIDQRDTPLVDRRSALEHLLGTRPSDAVLLSQVFEGSMASVLASACRLGLEGVIAKRRASPYRSTRSPDWVKLKCGLRQAFVVAGWTDPRGSRTGLGSLLLGYHDDAGRLVYAGNVGTGLSDRMLQALEVQLKALATDAMPFATAERIAGRPHWVRPERVVEVGFGEWTHDGSIRHAVFHGLRADKDPAMVVRETSSKLPIAQPRKQEGQPARKQPSASRRSTQVQVSHPERVIDATTGTTKLDLVRFYELVGDLMMSHLKQRPVSVLRAPDGVQGERFFQKHASVDRLDGVDEVEVTIDGHGTRMLRIASRRGLLAAAQWNVVEFHSFNFKTDAPDRPDRIVFDLDPGEGVAWREIQEATTIVRIFLEQLGLSAFLKTSGGKGLHVVAPIKRLHGWPDVERFCRAVVVHLAKTFPDRLVAKSGPKNRVGKIFIDHLRNRSGATTACAWTARARPGMGVSVPLDWSELTALKSSSPWTVRNIQQRLDVGNGPWAAYSRSARSLGGPMKTLLGP